MEGFESAIDFRFWSTSHTTKIVVVLTHSLCKIYLTQEEVPAHNNT